MNKSLKLTSLSLLVLSSLSASANSNVDRQNSYNVHTTNVLHEDTERLLQVSKYFKNLVASQPQRAYGWESYVNSLFTQSVDGQEHKHYANIKVLADKADRYLQLPSKEYIQSGDCYVDQMDCVNAFGSRVVMISLDADSKYDLTVGLGMNKEYQMSVNNGNPATLYVTYDPYQQDWDIYQDSSMPVAGAEAPHARIFQTDTSAFEELSDAEIFAYDYQDVLRYQDYPLDIIHASSLLETLAASPKQDITITFEQRYYFKLPRIPAYLKQALNKKRIVFKTKRPMMFIEYGSVTHDVNYDKLYQIVDGKWMPLL